MSQPHFQLDQLPTAITTITGPIVRLTFPEQGATSTVAILHASEGAFVLKRATRPPFTAWLQQEYTVLRALAATPLPVPKAHTLIVEHTSCWLLMDYLPGDRLSSTLAVEQNPIMRQKLLRAFGQALATIHECEPPLPLAASDPSWLDQALEHAAHNLAHYPVDGRLELLQTLQQHHPPPIRQTLIHGDFTLDNVLVHDGVISGIIDWAGGAYGDPRYDLALATRSQPEAFQSTAERAAFYVGYGSPPLSPAEDEYFLGLYEFF